jgi:type III restriction enzyme
METYELPAIISPMESTSIYGGSLYQAEEEMNGLERDLVIELTAVPSVRWWHRNIAKREFRINGFINHYPDLIIMTENGNIVLAETKGDHLKNDDSMQKARLGRAWQKEAGKKYRYYMVFRDDAPAVDGMINMNDFLDILKQL